MKQDEMTRTESVSKEFGLNGPLAREIIADQTRSTLLRSKLAWFVFVSGLIVSGWLLLQPATETLSALWILTLTVGAWYGIGRYQAGAAIRNAARQKRDNIDRWNS